MPVPKRKRSRARRDKRFANKGLKVASFASCSQCQDPILPHRACSGCGYYKGSKVLETKMDRTEKRNEHKQVKQASAQEESSAE
jgi:large subunit ribosomal protein L32